MVQRKMKWVCKHGINVSLCLVANLYHHLLLLPQIGSSDIQKGKEYIGRIARLCQTGYLSLKVVKSIIFLKSVPILFFLGPETNLCFFVICSITGMGCSDPHNQPNTFLRALSGGAQGRRLAGQKD